MPLGKCFAISPITGYSVVEASDGLEALGGLKEDSVGYRHFRFCPAENSWPGVGA